MAHLKAHTAENWGLAMIQFMSCLEFFHGYSREGQQGIRLGPNLIIIWNKNETEKTNAVLQEREKSEKSEKSGCTLGQA